MRNRKISPVWTLVLCLALAITPVATMAQKGKSPQEEKININTATVDQLQTLPGVGPSLASSILEYRQKVGKFKKIEEILNIKGMGEKKFQKIKDRLVV